ncbi:hypothetical protein DHOM_05465 [Dermabacter hominis 1368]|uniref:Uncharacterized protein n=1 Tax=Dermabacter hominis 1368 TaxID=1450519 RepID=A0ABR4SKH0_9MICO|nr:hypothetical protein DHOM_05465 [Dermabacter hominis 1368]
MNHSTRPPRVGLWHGFHTKRPAASPRSAWARVPRRSHSLASSGFCHAERPLRCTRCRGDGAALREVRKTRVLASPHRRGSARYFRPSRSSTRPLFPGRPPHASTDRPVSACDRIPRWQPRGTRRAHLCRCTGERCGCPREASRRNRPVGRVRRPALVALVLT